MWLALFCNMGDDQALTCRHFGVFQGKEKNSLPLIKKKKKEAIISSSHL